MYRSYHKLINQSLAEDNEHFIKYDKGVAFL